MSKKNVGIVGVAIGAIAAVAAVGAAKYIEHEHKQSDLRKKQQASNVKLKYDPTQQTSISILSHHGKFMSCIKNEFMNCNSKKRSNPQTFISVPIKNDGDNDIQNNEIRIALKTFNGKYVSVQKKDGLIQCNRDNIGKWEIFTVHQFTNKKNGRELWSFKSCHNKYVSAQWFAGKLIANRDKCENWEKFIVQIVDWDDDDW
eukprot:UN01285